VVLAIQEESASNVSFEEDGGGGLAVAALPRVATASTAKYLTQNIELLRPGDSVLSRSQDDGDGALEQRSIEEVFVRRTNLLQVATVLSSDGTRQTLYTTQEHPFYVPEVGWVVARDLQVGDRLTEADGGVSTVIDAYWEHHPEGLLVYNFRVRECHTYFVRAEGSDAEPVWVHNADYSSVKDPADVVKNTKPTARQVQEMKALNRKANGGVLRDDVTGELMVDSAKSVKGVQPPSNEAQVDHIIPASRGGTRSSTNLELRTRANNRAKWDKIPGEA
jgi:hypothetical protein